MPDLDETALVDRRVNLHEDMRGLVREKANAEIPSWYSPVLHLLFPSAVGIACIVFAAMQLHDVKPMELLLVPLVFTSTDGMIRRLGAKRWKQLHRLVYWASALAIAHLAWTEVDNHTNFQRTKKALVCFVILMALRWVPLGWLRKKLRRSAATRSSPDR